LNNILVARTTAIVVDQPVFTKEGEVERRTRETIREEKEEKRETVEENRRSGNE